MLKLLDVLCNWTFLLKIYQLDKEGVSIYIPIMCYQFFFEYRPRDNRVPFTVTKPLTPYKLMRF